MRVKIYQIKIQYSTVPVLPSATVFVPDTTAPLAVVNVRPDQPEIAAS